MFSRQRTRWHGPRSHHDGVHLEPRHGAHPPGARGRLRRRGHVAPLVPFPFESLPSIPIVHDQGGRPAGWDDSFAVTEGDVVFLWGSGARGPPPSPALDPRLGGPCRVSMSQARLLSIAISIFFTSCCMGSSFSSSAFHTRFLCPCKNSSQTHPVSEAGLSPPIVRLPHDVRGRGQPHAGPHRRPVPPRHHCHCTRPRLRCGPRAAVCVAPPPRPRQQEGYLMQLN